VASPNSLSGVKLLTHVNLVTLAYHVKQDSISNKTQGSSLKLATLSYETQFGVKVAWRALGFPRQGTILSGEGLAPTNQPSSLFFRVFRAFRGFHCLSGRLPIKKAGAKVGAESSVVADGANGRGTN